MADLPPWLATAIEAHLEGRARSDLAARSARISAAYRAGEASRTVIGGEADALAYAVARMPATFAVASRVLAEVADLLPDFAPESVLDAGAGPGTAGLAASELWPSIRRLTQADHNAAFLDLARRFAEASGVEPAQIRCELGRLPPEPAGVDLAILSYVLAEAAVERAAALAELLWARASGALVLIEPGTPGGTARILAARDRLIERGARVLAPCPHDATCPLHAPDWCHFAERLARRRAHMSAKNAVVPFENEPFIYLVAVRAPLFRFRPYSRILTPPAVSKAGIDLRLCRTDGTAARERIPRRDKRLHAAVRRLGWGDRVEADPPPPLPDDGGETL